MRAAASQNSTTIDSLSAHEHKQRTGMLILFAWSLPVLVLPWLIGKIPLMAWFVFGAWSSLVDFETALSVHAPWAWPLLFVSMGALSLKIDHQAARRVLQLSTPVSPHPSVAQANAKAIARALRRQQWQSQAMSYARLSVVAGSLLCFAYKTLLWSSTALAPVRYSLYAAAMFGLSWMLAQTRLNLLPLSRTHCELTQLLKNPEAIVLVQYVHKDSWLPAQGASPQMGSLARMAAAQFVLNHPEQCHCVFGIEFPAPAPKS